MKTTKLLTLLAVLFYTTLAIGLAARAPAQTTIVNNTPPSTSNPVSGQ